MERIVRETPLQSIQMILMIIPRVNNSRVYSNLLLEERISITVYNAIVLVLFSRSLSTADSPIVTDIRSCRVELFQRGQSQTNMGCITG